jgi:uncharacterized protein YukE
MPHSEVAQLLARIDAEYQSAWQGLYGQAMTASHAAISAHMTSLSHLREQLVHALGETEGNKAFCAQYFRTQTYHDSPPPIETK